MTVNGDTVKLDLNYDWVTTQTDGKGNESTAPASQEVDAILDDAVRLGGQTMSSGLTVPAAFGSLARTNGNEAARAHYNETFKKDRWPVWRNF